MTHRTHSIWPSVYNACMAAALLTLSGCGLLPKGHVDLDVSSKDRGVASWYGADFHGRLAADGRPFDMYALTAAHRSLPLGSVVRVLNVRNGRSVVVRITDRGPYAPGRVIDLSYAAASRLGIAKQGLAPVILDVVGEARLLAQWNQSAREPLGRAVEGPTAGPWQVEGGREPGDGANGGPKLHDVWGLPRQRRVADVLAANHYVDRRVAVLLMV